MLSLPRLPHSSCPCSPNILGEHRLTSDSVYLKTCLLQICVDSTHLNVLGESRSENIFVWPELMSGLPHDGVDHVKPRDLVLVSALLDELLNTLRITSGITTNTIFSLCWHISGQNIIHGQERNATFPFPESCPIFLERDRNAVSIRKGGKE